MLGYQDDSGVNIYKTNWTDTLKQRFELKNLEKIEAKRTQRWGWHKLPDVLPLYQKMNDTVRVPMGILSHAPQLFSLPTVRPYVQFPGTAFTPRDEQENAVNELLKFRSGLLHASTGKGKTLMACMIIRKLGVRTLILVKDITLMKQMVNDIHAQFGLHVRYYGGSMTKKYEKQINTDDIVVCNIDSRDKIGGTFDCVICDEAHALIQSTQRRDFICSLSTKYLYGMTGTPQLNGVDDEAFRIIFGKKTQLLGKNYVPVYHRVITNYIGYLDSADAFANFETEIYEDEERNSLIVKTILSTLGNRKGIVFTKRIEHAKVLAKALSEVGVYVETMIGETSSDERERIKKAIIAHEGPCVIIGSVKIIGTGFDCPPLSVAYLTTAEKFQGNITQYVGRIVRDFPGKTDCHFYDFCDLSTGVLANQSKLRVNNLKKEYPTITIKIQ